MRHSTFTTAASLLEPGHTLAEDGYVYDQDDQAVARECQDCGAIYSLDYGCTHDEPLCLACGPAGCSECATEAAQQYEDDWAMRAYGEDRS